MIPLQEMINKSLSYSKQESLQEEMRDDPPVILDHKRDKEELTSSLMKFTCSLKEKSSEKINSGH
jgi:hypothetical protein